MQYDMGIKLTTKQTNIAHSRMIKEMGGRGGSVSEQTSSSKDKKYKDRSAGTRHLWIKDVCFDLCHRVVESKSWSASSPILMSASLSTVTITSLLRPLRSKTFCQRRIVTSFYVWITHPSKRNDNHIENGELQSLWKCHYSWWICTCELTRCCAN